MLRLLIVTALFLWMNIAFTEAATGDIAFDISIVSTDGTAYSEAIKSRYIGTEMVMQMAVTLQSSVSLTSTDYFHLSTTQDYAITGSAISCKQISVSDLSGSGTITMDTSLTASFTANDPKVLSFGLAQSSSFTSGQIITLQCSGLTSPTTPTSSPTETLRFNDETENLSSSFPVFDVYPITATLTWSTANTDATVSSSLPVGYRVTKKITEVIDDEVVTTGSKMSVTAVDDDAPEVVDLTTSAIGLDSSLWEMDTIFKATPSSSVGYTIQTHFRDYPDGYITDVTTCTYSNGTQSVAVAFTAATTANNNTASVSYAYEPLALIDDDLTHRIRCLITFANVHIPISPALSNDVVEMVLTATPATTVYYMSTLARLPVYPSTFTSMKISVQSDNLYNAVDWYKLQALAALFENEIYDILSSLNTYSETTMNNIDVNIYTHTPAEVNSDSYTLYNSLATFYVQWVPDSVVSDVRQALVSSSTSIQEKIGFRLGTGDSLTISFDVAEDVELDSTCLNGRLSSGETDVDCGGDCSGCVGNKNCISDDDCLQTCVDNLCTGNSANYIAISSFIVGMFIVNVMMMV